MNLLDEIIKNSKKYKIIVSNPPYIKEEDIKELMNDVKEYEPHTALNGGSDGLVFYRNIVEHSVEALEENGVLAFEIGFDQGDDVKELVKRGRL